MNDFWGDRIHIAFEIIERDLLNRKLPDDFWSESYYD